jgi:hypothetical protein
MKMSRNSLPAKVLWKWHKKATSQRLDHISVSLVEFHHPMGAQADHIADIRRIRTSSRWGPRRNLGAWLRELWGLFCRAVSALLNNWLERLYEGDWSYRHILGAFVPMSITGQIPQHEEDGKQNRNYRWHLAAVTQAIFPVFVLANLTKLGGFESSCQSSLPSKKVLLDS